MRFAIKIISAAAVICVVTLLIMPRPERPHATGRPLKKPFAESIAPTKQPPPSPALQSITPALSFGDAATFVETLCAEGKFKAALALAKNSDEEHREDRLRVVFAQWTQTDPAEAMKALGEIAEDSTRAMLFRTVTDIWSANDPAALASYTLALPDSEDRNYAFAKATDNWSLQDPAAMGEWLNALPSNPDFDQTIAALVAKTDSENRSPEIAMSWVEGINDPELRRSSLEVVARQWAETDLPAAENYVAHVSWITPADRNVILQSLAQPKRIAYEN